MNREPEPTERQTDDLVRRFPLAMDAVSGGWILGLWDFCRDHGRHPELSEQRRIMNSSRLADQRIADIQAGTFMPRTRRGMGMNEACLRFADAVLTRREIVGARIRSKVEAK